MWYKRSYLHRASLMHIFFVFVFFTTTASFVFPQCGRDSITSLSFSIFQWRRWVAFLVHPEQKECACLFPSKKSEWMNRYTWKPSARKSFVKTPRSSSSLSTSPCVQRRILETITIVAKTLRQNVSGSVSCGRPVVAVADGGGRRRVHGSRRRWQMRKRHEESSLLYLCNCTFQFALTPVHLV
jgi:hypothetical protein